MVLLSHLLKWVWRFRHLCISLIFQTEYKQDLASPGLTERLPEECVREILLRLDTGEDIVRAGDACALMGGIAKETRIWRELVQSHFTPAQIAYVVNTKPQLQVTTEYRPEPTNQKLHAYIYLMNVCIENCWWFLGTNVCLPIGFKVFVTLDTSALQTFD